MVDYTKQVELDRLRKIMENKGKPLAMPVAVPKSVPKKKGRPPKEGSKE